MSAKGTVTIWCRHCAQERRGKRIGGHNVCGYCGKKYRALKRAVTVCECGESACRRLAVR